jgi:hypothetical protein
MYVWISHWLINTGSMLRSESSNFTVMNYRCTSLNDSYSRSFWQQLEHKSSVRLYEVSSREHYIKRSGLLCLMRPINTAILIAILWWKFNLINFWWHNDVHHYLMMTLPQRYFRQSITLYGCETWTLTLREEHRLRVFENRVLRRGMKWQDLTYLFPFTPSGT